MSRSRLKKLAYMLYYGNNMDRRLAKRVDRRRPHMSIAALICRLFGHKFSCHGYDYYGKNGSMVCNRCAKEAGQ